MLLLRVLLSFSICLGTQKIRSHGGDVATMQRRFKAFRGSFFFPGAPPSAARLLSDFVIRLKFTSNFFQIIFCETSKLFPSVSGSSELFGSLIFPILFHNNFTAISYELPF